MSSRVEVQQRLNLDIQTRATLMPSMKIGCAFFPLRTKPKRGDIVDSLGQASYGIEKTRSTPTP